MPGGSQLIGFKQIDGTASGFTESEFENGYLYFVRTNAEKTEGYLWLNGKRYGEMKKVIDCGTFHGPQSSEPEPEPNR